MPPELARLGFAALWNPDFIVGFSLVAIIYLMVVGPLRPFIKGSAPVARRTQVAFVAAVVLTYLAVGSPLDALSDDYLFSAHMLEHMILTMLTAPLLLVGIPDWIWRKIYRTRVGGGILKVFTRPVMAIILFNVIFSVLHFPGLYDLALQSETIHFLEHAVMVATALFMWWPVLSRLPELPAVPEPIQILYMFVDGLLMIVSFALVTFAPQPLYTFYVHAPRVFGLSPLQDQQLGGIIMKGSTTIAYGLWIIVAFFRWVRRERMMEEFGLLPTSRSQEDPQSLREGEETPYRIWKSPLRSKHEH